VVEVSILLGSDTVAMNNLLLTFCGHVIVSEQWNKLPRDAASHRRTVTSAQGLSEETHYNQNLSHSYIKFSANIP
jgi:hypothetical protein